MKTYTYVAITDNDEGYICEAKNKKQMKLAGMNMRLDWQRRDSYDTAVIELKCSGIELKNSSNVTNFKHWL